ncbi:unnamed protein product [Mesocestoides corti]|uniref:Suppressor of cytokine signaling 7 n=1 Tax=Mesocestoides corti TaxID=53468 RepID=A0A0R3UDY4_MESCO|nr:unnamed protein product [Mesocestoides corti]
MLHKPVTVSSRYFVVSFVSERAATLSPGDPSIYYRLATTSCYQSSGPDQHRGASNIPDSTFSNNLADRFLRWFRAGDSGGGGGGGREPTAEHPQIHRRRSKSQPPQLHQRIQVVQIDPRCMQAAFETNATNVPKRNGTLQHQRPDALVSPDGRFPTSASRRRELPPAPCTCSHHHQYRQTTQQISQSSTTTDNQHRSRLPRWLFPCGPHHKHSHSPPPSGSLCVVSARCEVPPPPPPRSTAIKSKPPTRSVEVQTQLEPPPPCCCATAAAASSDIESALCGFEDLSGCCAGQHKQHIMLHHYHFHHYYHCEAEQPSATEPADSRPSSPLIKLSVTWPPTAAVPEERATPLIREECGPRQGSPTVEQAIDGDPPAPVSDALRAIESAKVETPTGSSTLPNFKIDELEQREKEAAEKGTVITPTPTASIVDMSQMDQRRIFLQNINQLKRTGWYWGPLTIEEAELLLKDRPNGSFLVRDSGHELYILSVSFRAENRTYHTRIEHTGGKFSFAVQGDADTTSPSIAQFISHVIAESERGRTRFFLRQSALTTSANQQAGTTSDQSEDENRHVEARLLYPVSRFLVVHSLAHLCRFEILLKVRKDHIDLLPLPDCLKHYLHERQYYTEFVQAYLESAGHLLPNTSSVQEETEVEDHV